MEEDNYNRTLKVVLLGSSYTGKSSIILRLLYDTFDEYLNATISAYNNTYQINNITFDIWDLSGQERFLGLNRIMVRNANVLIFVYNITQKSSFEFIQKELYSRYLDICSPNPIICLVANFNDRFAEEQVTEEEGRNYANRIGALFFMTSCLDGSGVREIFEEIANQINNSNTNSIGKNERDIDFIPEPIRLNPNDKMRREVRYCCDSKIVRVRKISNYEKMTAWFGKTIDTV